MDYQYKVIRPFKDKHTGKYYTVGDTYECSLKRFKELFFKDNDYNEQYLNVDVPNNAKKAELLEVADVHDIKVTENNTKVEIVKVLEG